MAKKPVEYRACPVCKTRFRLSRTWKQYCSPGCAKKAKRERAASVIPVHPIKEEASVAVPPQNDGQTAKKSLPNEGVVSPKSKRKHPPKAALKRSQR
jgi:hypothetical protein